MIAWTERLAGRTGPGGPVVELALTDRLGGSSAGPYAAADGAGGLNLGVHVGDDPALVAANRAAVAAALVGCPPTGWSIANQVHGATVVHVDGPWAGAPPDADALVTTTADLALAVLVADCVPVLLAAPDDGVVGGRARRASRDGRRRRAGAPCAAMRDLGRRGRSWPGSGRRSAGAATRCRSSCASRSPRSQPASRTVTWTGTPALDVAAGVLEPARRPGRAGAAAARLHARVGRASTPTGATAGPAGSPASACARRAA